MSFIGALCILAFFVFPSGAAGMNMTLFLDGALCSQELVVSKGVVEVSLPVNVAASSLRVKPLDGNSIETVEVSPIKPDSKHARETAYLIKKRDALKDRLQTLDVKEEILKAAAKSQSGKSPRKTKANSDPLGTIRQGTDLAFSQLEEVFHARRKAENDLNSVEARLTTLNKESRGSVAKISISGKRGRIAASYIRSDLKWVPSYDFRLNKPGEVEVIMRALLPAMERGMSAKIATARLSDVMDEPVLPIPLEKFPKIVQFIFPTAQEKITFSPVSSISFSFTNSSPKSLPAGEISCYWRGEYWGKSTFPGSLPGDVATLTFGR